MSEKFDAILPKIAPLIRLLSSPTEQEAMAALRMLLRLLSKHGLDIHALAERIEHGGGEPLSAAEMQRIYDSAFEQGFAKGAEQGRRSAILAAAQIGTFATNVENDVGSGVNGYSWQQVATHCATNSHLFPDKQREFVEDMPGKIAKFGSPTPKQAEYLRSLFMRKFGGRIE